MQEIAFCHTVSMTPCLWTTSHAGKAYQFLYAVFTHDVDPPQIFFSWELCNCFYTKLLFCINWFCVYFFLTVIRPKQFQSLIEKEVKEGLRDLSVSRPRGRLQWGIPVPDDSSQTVCIYTFLYLWVFIDLHCFFFSVHLDITMSLVNFSKKIHFD